MNLLVTGGCGFIGSHFIEALLAEDEEVNIVNIDALTYAGSIENTAHFSSHPRYYFIQGDICSEALVTDILKHRNIHQIVHFAAETHVDRSIASGYEFVRTNVEGTRNMVACAKKQWYESTNSWEKGHRMILVSTDEVYGTAGAFDCFDEESPLKPRNPYAASKASGDLLAMSFFHTYGFPLIITRSCNNFGPRQHSEKFIPQMILKAKEGSSLTVYGDGLQVREWIHVKDHCEALRMVLKEGQLGEIYNIGTGYRVANLSICKKILEVLHKPATLLTHVEDRLGHDRRYAISAEKIKADLGWESITDFERALEALCHEETSVF